MDNNYKQYTNSKEAFFGWYFWLALVGAVAVASFWVLYMEYGYTPYLRAQFEQRLEGWNALERAQNYAHFSCDVEQFSDDALLQKINNNRPPLRANYVPSDLVSLGYQYTHPKQGVLQVRAVVKEPLIALIRSGREAGHYLRVNSAYRSSVEQQAMYERFADNAGVDEQGERAALPGLSEHQLGTAIDISSYPSATASGYEWLAENAYKYGFVLSYPDGAQDITQYQYEPWHWRYVGTEIAEHIYANKMLYNHKRALFLPSPIDMDTILTYEYEGRDLWVWKYQEGQDRLDVLIEGEVEPSYQRAILKIIKQFNRGAPPTDLGDDYLRSWVIQDQKAYTDEYGNHWQATVLASHYGNSPIERVLMLYRTNVGYMIISYQTQDATDRLIKEFTSSCRVR
ncbi:MAG: M15 family metallopeptidase [Patescibacteria group bacterium]